MGAGLSLDHMGTTGQAWGPSLSLSSRCLPSPADSTENPMIYLCPGAASAQAAGRRRIQSVPEREERGEKGGKERNGEGEGRGGPASSTKEPHVGPCPQVPIS